MQSWKLFIALVLGLFVARGIMLMCVLPPLEAWDEYQHVGYLQFVQEESSWPILNRAFVPQSVLNGLRDMPQSEAAVSQIGASNATTYASYWRGGEEKPLQSAKRPMLYAAQHAPAYYLLAQPLWRLSPGVDDLRTSVAIMRGFNLLLMIGALALFAFTLRVLSTDRLVVSGTIFLLALHPMFLMGGVRVSNDALAVLLASAGCLCLARYMTAWPGNPRPRVMWAAAAGLFAGIGIWAKSTDAALIPLALFAIAYPLQAKRSTWRRSLVDLCVLGGVCALVLAPLIWHNLATYRVMLVTCEGLENQARHAGALAIAQGVAEIPWIATGIRMWWSEALWCGGWSFIRPVWWVLAAWGLVEAWLCVIALAGCLPGLVRDRVARLIGAQSLAIAFCLAALAATSLALSYHALQTYVLTGFVMTNAWYTLQAVPFALLLVVSCISVGPVRGVWIRLSILAIGAVMLAAEFAGSFGRMATLYSASGEFPANVRRLSELQPAALNTHTLWTAAAASVVLAILLGAFLMRVGSTRGSISNAGSAKDSRRQYSERREPSQEALADRR